MGKFHASIILTSALPKAAIFLQYFIPNDKTDIGFKHYPFIRKYYNSYKQVE